MADFNWQNPTVESTRLIHIFSYLNAWSDILTLTCSCILPERFVCPTKKSKSAYISLIKVFLLTWVEEQVERWSVKKCVWPIMKEVIITRRISHFFMVRNQINWIQGAWNCYPTLKLEFRTFRNVRIFRGRTISFYLNSFEVDAHASERGWTFYDQFLLDITFFLRINSRLISTIH